MTNPVFVANTNLITLTGLTNQISGELIEDATVTVTIVDTDNADVGGQTWPATLDPVDGTPGLYRAVLDAEVDLTAGRKYTAIVDAVANLTEDSDPVSGVGHWEFVFTAKTRHGS